MKPILWLCVPLLLCAQVQAPPPAPTVAPAPAPAQAPAAEPAAEPAPTPAAEPAADPAPTSTAWVSGSVDAGYRWNNGVSGEARAYRSIVDLGEGPRLLNFDLQFLNPSKKLVDRATLRGNGWGGDPYATLFADLSLESRYRLSIDYRDLAYYNFLPSFSNPGIENGSLLSQNAYDTHRRLANIHLDLLPGGRFVPFFAFSRDAGSGTGVLNFVAEGNEYPVASRYNDRTRNYRGGVRIELNRFHATLEQGGLTFADDSGVFTSDRNLGNRTTPFLTQQLFLNRADQSYAVRGDSIYSRALFTASPVEWADVHGQFLFSQPTTTATYTEDASGRFVSVSRLLFFDRQQRSASGEAKQPHTSGSLGIELRPIKRVRIIESWLTDRLHNASGGVVLEPLLTTSPISQSDRLEMNYNRQELDVLWDAPARLTFRGGHRFVWGDARVRGPVLSGMANRESKLRRHSALAAISYRPMSHVTANVEAEVGVGDDAYFRTSLYDFRKIKARMRFQPAASLSVSAQFFYLDNQNPDPAIQLDQTMRNASTAVVWTPGGGKHISLTGEYSRATVLSDVFFREPQSLLRELSRYRENAHTASAIADLRLAGTHTPLIAVGGSFFVSSGSRPVRYYQPLVRLSAPLYRHIHWLAEWRWYGFTEPFQSYEDFRSHQFVAGLRWTRD